MATYGCDLGFDWNAAPVDASPGPLQAYLMDKDNQDKPAWFTQLHWGDTLFFVLYDITGLNGGTKVEGPTLDFKLAITGTTLTATEAPLSPASYQWSNFNGNATIGSLPDGPSAAFSVPPTLQIPRYSVGPVGSGTEGSFGQVYTLTPPPGIHDTDTQFYNLSARLTVTDTNGNSNVYIFDPEMIVGPST